MQGSGQWSSKTNNLEVEKSGENDWISNHEKERQRTTQRDSQNAGVRNLNVRCGEGECLECGLATRVALMGVVPSGRNGEAPHCID